MAYISTRIPYSEEPLFHVPLSRNQNFVGQDDILKKLKQTLPYLQQCSLYGKAGTGKSHIALEFVYWIQQAFPWRSVLWVHANSAEQFRQSYEGIARACKIPEYQDPQMSLSHVKQWLETQYERRWLMVLDNADDEDLFFGATLDGGNISGLLPQCPDAAILITTRSQRIAQSKTPTIEVHGLSQNEGFRLVHTLLPEYEKAGSDKLTELCFKLCHSPLTLTHVANYSQQTEIKIESYLERANKFQKDVVGESKIFLLLKQVLSDEQILLENLNPLANQLLLLIILLDPDSIPWEILQHCGNQDGQSDARIFSALKVLTEGCILLNTNDHQVTMMHRVIQDALKEMLVQQGLFEYCTGEAIFTMSAVFPAETVKNRAICERLLPHALAVLKYDGTGSKEELLAKATLLHSTAIHLHYKGRHKEAHEKQQKAIELRWKILGEIHFQTLNSVSSLASMHLDQGQLKQAKDLAFRVWKSKKRVLGEDHPNTVASLSEVVAIHKKTGDWSEAEKLESQILTSKEKRLGAESSVTLDSMSHLATLYQNQGRWDEAEMMQRQVLSILHRARGNLATTWASMASLAATLSSQGQMDKARELIVKVAVLRKKMPTRKHQPKISRNLGQKMEAGSSKVEMRESSRQRHQYNSDVMNEIAASRLRMSHFRSNPPHIQQRVRTEKIPEELDRKMPAPQCLNRTEKHKVTLASHLTSKGDGGPRISAQPLSLNSNTAISGNGQLPIGTEIIKSIQPEYEESLQPTRSTLLQAGCNSLRCWLSVISWSSSYHFQTIMETVGIFKPPHKKGSRRLRWRCSCGSYLWADFENSHPEALEEFSHELHCPPSHQCSVLFRKKARGISERPDQEHNSERAGAGQSVPSTAVTTASLGTRTLHGHRTSNGGSGNTNLGEEEEPSILNQNARVTARSPGPWNNHFFEVCISRGSYEVRLKEIDLSEIRSDGDLFFQIWERYTQTRILNMWRIFLKPWDVHFVKFSVSQPSHDLAAIHEKPNEYPPEEKLNSREYHYQSPKFPMPSHIFLHYFHILYGSDGQQHPPNGAWINKLPKKLNNSILETFERRRRSDGDIIDVYGWGVHIIEGPNHTMFFIASMFGTLIAFLASCLIVAIAGTEEQGFGVGSFLLAVLTCAMTSIYLALQDHCR